MPPIDRFVVNGMFLTSSVGTGTFTRAVVGALPWGEVWRPRHDLLRASTSTYYGKLAVEASLGRRHRKRHVLHPYLANAVDQRAYLVVLDWIGAVEHAWPQRVLRDAALASARGLAAISHSQADELVAHTRRAMAVLTPHPDAAFYEQLPSLAATSPRPKILYWGGNHPRKRVADLVSIAGLLTDVEFRLVGVPTRGGTLENLKYLPTLSAEDLIREIDRADLCVYLSTQEGFGLPPYEALLRGRRVLVDSLPSYRDFVRPGAPDVHYLPPDRSRESLRDAVVRAMQQPLDGMPVRNLLYPTLAQAQAVLREQLLNWIVD